VQLREGLDTAELQGWIALGLFRVRKPDAGMPECTTLVRGCMDDGDFGSEELSSSSQMQSLAPCRNLSVRLGAEGLDTSTKNRPRFEAAGRRACRMPRGQTIGIRMARHLPAVLEGVT